MSIVKELKGARTRIEAMQAELEAATTERDALAAQVAALGEDHDAAIAALTASHDEALAENAATLAAHVTQIADLTQVRDEQATRITEIEGHAAELTRALEDPGYRIAKAEGTDPAPDGGTAGGETKSLYAQLQAITDPGKRNAFYRAHQAEIKAEAKSL